MAVVIAVAAVMVLPFHRFRQPLILGYLVAGIICAPQVKSAAFVWYQTTAKALRWAILCLYLFVGFVILAPMVNSLLKENPLFAVFAITSVATILAALWDSLQTVN